MNKHPDSFCSDRNCGLCGNYISGFVDGEGMFLLGKYKRLSGLTNGYARFGIKLRLDDISILNQIKGFLRCGRITISKGKLENPQVRYQVANLESLVRVIIPFFEKNPLRAKKLRDFLIWKEAVLLIYKISCRPWVHRRGRNHLGVFPKWRADDDKQFEELRVMLRDVRVFKNPSDLQFPKTRLVAKTEPLSDGFFSIGVASF